MKQTRRAPRRGATLVEFAFIVPWLLLILLGIIEFGWYARNQLAIANATREGARAASIGRTEPDIKTRVVNAAKPVTITTENVTVSYSGDNGGTYSTNLPQNDTSKNPVQNGIPPGSLVRVTVSVAHRRLAGLPITPARVNVQVSMVRERS